MMMVLDLIHLSGRGSIDYQAVIAKQLLLRLRIRLYPY